MGEGAFGHLRTSEPPLLSLGDTAENAGGAPEGKGCKKHLTLICGYAHIDDMKRRTLPPNPKIITAVARRFRVLGEPQRLRILQVLEAGPQTVTQLVEALQANQPNVSRHLQALFEAGLIARRRSGNSIIYSVSDPMVFRLCELVCNNVVERARAEMAEIVMSVGAAPAKRSSR